MNEHISEKIQYGLIGRSLGHSHSEKYFKSKFSQLQLKNYDYHLFEMNDVKEIRSWAKDIEGLHGLNVTIPFKSTIIEYLDEIDPIAKKIGAVNCIKIRNKHWKGFNTDVIGFDKTIDAILKLSNKTEIKTALILGSGGSSKAVQWVLDSRKIPFKIVSRQKKKAFLCYKELTADLVQKYELIVNCTPLGMPPDIGHCPEIPYMDLSRKHLLIDLIYNPDKTLFLTLGARRTLFYMNGMLMLEAQAEASWNIWNE